MFKRLLAFTDIIWCNGVIEHNLLPSKYVWYSCSFGVKVCYKGPQRFTVLCVLADGAILIPEQYTAQYEGEDLKISIRRLNLIPYGGRVPCITVELKENNPC